MPYSLQQVQQRLLTITKQQVFIGRAVAALYAAETKRIKEAERNSPDKFPEGYLTQLSVAQKKEPVKNVDRLACHTELVSVSPYEI